VASNGLRWHRSRGVGDEVTLLDVPGTVSIRWVDIDVCTAANVPLIRIRRRAAKSKAIMPIG
jgi:hypothetical protein